VEKEGKIQKKRGRKKKIEWLTICVMSRNEGSLHASAAPANALNALRLAKLLQAAWSMRKNPHMKMLEQPSGPSWKSARKKTPT
jgi:hypothetical protein